MITFEVFSYSEIMNLSSDERREKIIENAKKGKIILIQGRLSYEEEMELIKAALIHVNNEFKGIELAVLEPKAENKSFLDKVRYKLIKIFGGGMIEGITLVGPANLVSEIKRDPSQVQWSIVTDSKKRGK